MVKVMLSRLHTSLERKMTRSLISSAVRKAVPLTMRHKLAGEVLLAQNCLPDLKLSASHSWLSLSACVVTKIALKKGTRVSSRHT